VVAFDVPATPARPPLGAATLSGAVTQTLLACAVLVYFVSIFATIAAPPGAKRAVAASMLGVASALILSGAGVHLAVRRKLGAALD
jgi:hypothetical protein